MLSGYRALGYHYACVLTACRRECCQVVGLFVMTTSDHSVLMLVNKDALRWQDVSTLTMPDHCVLTTGRRGCSQVVGLFVMTMPGHYVLTLAGKDASIKTSSSGF